MPQMKEAKKIQENIETNQTVETNRKTETKDGARNGKNDVTLKHK
jgi:hypothetical protein